MSFWRQVTRGLRVLLNRTAADRDIADEVEHYLDEATGELWRPRGLSPEEARRAARLELGSVTGVREQVREYGWEHVVDTTVTDVRHGIRRLRRSPVFAIRRCAHAGAGRRRQHGDLQRGQPDSVSAAAVPGCRTPDDDLGSLRTGPG